MCASGTEIFKYFPKNLARRFLVVGQFKVSRPSGEFFTTVHLQKVHPRSISLLNLDTLRLVPRKVHPCSISLLNLDTLRLVPIECC